MVIGNRSPIHDEAFDKMLLLDNQALAAARLDGCLTLRQLYLLSRRLPP